MVAHAHPFPEGEPVTCVSICSEAAYQDTRKTRGIRGHSLKWQFETPIGRDPKGCSLCEPRLCQLVKGGISEKFLKELVCQSVKENQTGLGQSTNVALRACGLCAESVLVKLTW